MNGIPKENNLRSVSLYALSNVDITFDQDTDRNFARQQVFNRLADLDLAERRHAGRRAADLAVGPDLPLHAAKPRPLADRAQDVRGLGRRAAIPVGPGRRRRFRVRRRDDAISGAARPISPRRRRPVAAAGRKRARREQRQRRRRILLRRRPILLCPRPRPADHAGRHRQRRRRRARRHPDPGQGCRPGHDSALRRASASSGSASRTTPSKA